MTPKHIAIILDGNRRWAQEQNKPTLEGHTAGAKNLEIISEAVQKMGVKYFTVYALSNENLKKRTTEELAYHFGLHKKYITNEILNSERFMRDKIRFRVLGRVAALPEDEQQLIREAEEKTKNNDAFHFNVCLAYDGQDEIVDAVKSIVSSGISAESITRETIKSHVYTKDIPAPEMIIRTGMKDEKRLSGFLLWDCSYSEFFFTKTFWPAFSENELKEMIGQFASRERRFGK